MTKDTFSFEDALTSSTFSFEEAIGATQKPQEAYERQASESDQEVVTSARGWRGAGGGRGSYADPRRLDQESGRKLLKVEDRLNDLEKINPRTREELRPYAESMVDAPERIKPPVDRVRQYLDVSNPDQYQSESERQTAAELNAGFDKERSKRINDVYANREADPITGEKIAQDYNPNSSSARVSELDKEQKDARLSTIGSQVAEDFNPVYRGLIKGGVQSVGLTAAAAAYVGDALGQDAWKKWGLDVNNDASKIANQLTLSKNASDISSADEFGQWLAENAGYVAYQATEALLTGGAGAALGKQVGKEAAISAIGMGLNNLRQTLGSVYADAVEESKATGKPMPSLLQIAAGAVGSAAVDTVADKLGLDALTASGFKGNVLTRMAKSVGSQMAIQGGTEAAQLIPEDLGAGKDPFRTGAVKRFFDEGAVGALGGAGPGIMGGVRESSQEPLISTEIQKTSAVPDNISAAALNSEKLQDRAKIAIQDAPDADSAIAAFVESTKPLGRTSDQELLSRLPVENSIQESANVSTPIGDGYTAATGIGQDGDYAAGSGVTNAIDGTGLGNDNAGRDVGGVDQRSELPGSIPDSAVTDPITQTVTQNTQSDYTNAPNVQNTAQTGTQVEPAKSAFSADLPKPTTVEAPESGASQLATATELPGTRSPTVQADGVTQSPVNEVHFEAAKALITQQADATGNKSKENIVRIKLRKLASQVPENHAKTVTALDIAATRLGMGEGKLKGLEFAPAEANKVLNAPETLGASSTLTPIEIKDIYGRTHRVLQSDIDSGIDRIPTIRKNGDVVTGEEIPRSSIPKSMRSTLSVSAETQAPIASTAIESIANEPPARIGRADLPNDQKPDATDQQIAELNEAEYQQSIKDDIKVRLGLAKAPEVDQAKTPFKSFLREYGIASEHTSDIAGANRFKANNVLPATFRKSGLNLDALVERAIERGFMQEGDRGDQNKLVAMIQNEIAGETQISNDAATADAQAQYERVQRMEIEGMADRVGLPYDAGTSTDRLASMVNRVERYKALPKNKPGLLKADRVKANAFEMVARIERKRAQYEAESNGFAELAIAEQEALIDILTDAEGNPVVVSKAEMLAEAAWQEEQTLWDIQNEQANTASDSAARQAEAPAARVSEEGTRNAPENGSEAQPRSTETQGQEGLTLTSPTREDVIAQQDALEAEAKRKEDGGDKAIQKKVTADQVDLFNPQGSVFDGPADPIAETKATLDANNILGKERLDVLKDVKDGKLTVEDVKEAYPIASGKTDQDIATFARNGKEASSEQLSPGIDFWSKIKAGYKFNPKEIQDVLSQGKRGPSRAVSSMAGTTPVVGEVAAKQSIEWAGEIAGFDGYRTVGISTGAGKFAMAVIPSDLYRGNSAREISDTMVLGVSFTKVEDKYRLDVSEAYPGTKAFESLSADGRLKPTGNFDSNGIEYSKLLLDNENTTMRTLVQEAVRRLALHTGEVPTVFQAGRDTGARAGNQTIREYGADKIVEKFARSTSPQIGLPVSEVQSIANGLAKTWADGPRIKVVATTSDLPVEAPIDVRGLIHNGVAYLVAENHTDANGIAKTLLHEAVGHYGLLKMLGANGMRQFQNNLQLALRSGNNRLKAIQAQVRKLYIDENGVYNLSGEQEANEIAAFAVESGIDETGEFKPGFGFLKSIFAKITEFLRSKGFTIDFTNAELQGMLVNAMRGLETGKRLGGGGITMVTDAQDGSSAFARGKGQQPRPSSLREESPFMAVRRKLQDSFIQVREVQDMLTRNGGVVGESQDVYKAEERMHGRTQELLTDFARNQIEPFIEKAGALGVELDEISLYAYAMHAKERNEYISSINDRIGDAGSGMSNDEADRVISSVTASGNKDKFDELHKDLMGITDVTRRVLLDEGLITQEEYDGWTNLYQNYVPLRGFEDVDADTGTTRKGIGRGFSMTGKESVKALGRKSKAGDIIENIIRDYERAVIRSEKNQVAKTFLDLATSNPDPDLWEVQPVKVNRSFNKASGTVLMTRTPDTGDDTIAVKVAGQNVRVKINDQLLLRAMKNAAKDETGQLEGLLAETLAPYNSLLRNTLTRYNPIFGAINMVRDAQMGAFSAYDELGKEGAKLYAKYLGEAMAASFRFERDKADPQNKVMDKWIQEMRFAGGTTGGYHMRDTSEIADSMRSMMLAAGASPNNWKESLRGSQAYQMASGAAQWLEIIGSTSELAARAAAYRAARELGKSASEAASISKNLTTNFNRKGEYGQTLNSLYLFFNAGVQGTTRVMQGLSTRKVQIAMAGVTGAAMAIALMNAGMGDDDDGEAYWDKIPDYEKERNLIFMIPKNIKLDFSEKVGTDGQYVKIPIPYGINIFPVLGNQLADMVRYANDSSQGASPAKSAVRLASAVFGSVNPFGGSIDLDNKHSMWMAAMPTAMDTAYQLSNGLNGFARPVGPERSPYDDKPDSETFTARQAGGAAQVVSQFLNDHTGGNRGRSGFIDVMPGTLENVVRQTTGGLGVFLYDTLVNLPIKSMSPIEMTARDVPLVRNFYSQVDDVTDVTKFYERKAETAKVFAASERERKADIQVDYDEETQSMMDLGRYTIHLTKRLSRLRRDEIEIATSDSLTWKEKIVQRKEIEKERAEIAQDFNKEYIDERKRLALIPKSKRKPEMTN